MQSLPGQQDISYLHSLQAQSFPHIPKNHLQMSESSSPKPQKIDIYENPSEHYASINNYGVGLHQSPVYGGGIHLSQDVGTNGANFYGYGTDDYETGCSDYEAEISGLENLDARPTSSILGDRWADSSHSETEHDSDNNNKLVNR